jgi:hypothetical protein
MLCASALGAAEPAASPFGAVKTRGAMARRPLVDPVLIHRNPHAWVEHVAALAATTPLRLHRDTSLAD